MGDIEHPTLRELEIETGGLPGEAARSLDKAKLPKLERLTIWFGTDEYGGSSSVNDIQNLLAGKGYPKLRHLGLQNADFQDDLARAVCTAPIVERLSSLDLSMGTMGSDGANALADAADRLEHLEALNVEENFIGDAAVERLKKSLGQIVNIGHQEDEDDDYRYVSVGE